MCRRQASRNVRCAPMYRPYENARPGQQLTQTRLWAFPSPRAGSLRGLHPASLVGLIRHRANIYSIYGMSTLVNPGIEAYSEIRAVMTAGPPQLQQYTSPGDTSRSLPWMSHVPQVYAATIVSLSLMSSTTGSQSARSADGTSMTLIR